MTAEGHRIPHDNGKGRSRPFLTALAAIINLLEWSGKIIAFAMLALTFVTLLVNVVLRYTSGSGIAWAYEMHALTLPWLVGAGMIVATARSRNIAVSFLPDFLAPEKARFLLIAVNLVVLLIAATVLLSSLPILRASTFQSYSTQTLADLGIKQFWGYAGLVYAFSAMALIAAIEAVRLVVSPPLDMIRNAPQSLS
jgi:TRAP-type transport system small permease protein